MVIIANAGCGERRGLNILEVRALLNTVAQEGAKGCGQRQIYGLDSQIGLGALIKGRSPSQPIKN